MGVRDELRRKLPLAALLSRTACRRDELRLRLPLAALLSRTTSRREGPRRTLDFRRGEGSMWDASSVGSSSALAVVVLCWEGLQLLDELRMLSVSAVE